MNRNTNCKYLCVRSTIFHLFLTAVCAWESEERWRLAVNGGKLTSLIFFFRGTDSETAGTTPGKTLAHRDEEIKYAKMYTYKSEHPRASEMLKLVPWSTRLIKWSIFSDWAVNSSRRLSFSIVNARIWNGKYLNTPKTITQIIPTVWTKKKRISTSLRKQLTAFSVKKKRESLLRGNPKVIDVKIESRKRTDL